MKKVGLDNAFGVTGDRMKPATEKQVAALERRLGAKLPGDYRRFLMTINGGRRPGGGWELPKYELAIWPVGHRHLLRTARGLLYSPKVTVFILLMVCYAGG